MKITPRFIEVLKNYSIINPSILFMPGGEVSTISPLKNILSIATIDETIPQKFSIYDLNEFIGIVSIMDDPQAEFTQNQIILKSGRKSVKYTMGSPDTFECSPYENIDVDEDDIIAKFNLNYSDFSNIIKACSILKNKHLTIEGNEGQLEIKSIDNKNKTSSTYAINLNDKAIKLSSESFRRMFDIDNFKIMNRDYVVSIHKDYLIEFRSDDDSIVYWIAPSTETK